MIIANFRWLKSFSLQLCTFPHLRHAELCGNGLPVVPCCLIIILTYWSFLWISSSLWVCLFYRKALQWFAMKVIFLVSLLKKSSKYKSKAIWVLPTFCFHFILFCFLHTYFFSPKSQVQSIIFWMWRRLPPSSEYTVQCCCPGSCDTGHLCPQWAEFGYLVRLRQSTLWMVDYLAELQVN